MEPSFWSWEKEPQHAIPSRYRNGRNGAQLLELGKGTIHPRPRQRRTRRNGAQLLELGKVASIRRQQHRLVSPQWSPAFGAGKSRAGYLPRQVAEPSRNGAQLLELGKGGPRYLQESVPMGRNGAQLLELGKGPATPLD